MMYGGRDLYQEWLKEDMSMLYGEYVVKESPSITSKILEQYSFLLDIGYKEIVNIDKHIVRFERRENNCVFVLYYPNMNTLYLEVYYDKIPHNLSFNGDGEYAECITLGGHKVQMTHLSIKQGEKELKKLFNCELEKLKLKEE